MESARAAFAQIDLHLGIVARKVGRPRPRDAQDATVQADIDLRGVQSGREGVDLHAGRRASHVQRRQGSLGDRPDAAGQRREAEHVIDLAAQPLELSEDAIRLIEHRCVHVVSSKS